MSIISVRLETIRYGGWDELQVAIDIEQADNKTLYLTYPTVETILNYRPDSVREKLKSKSLKSFIGEGKTVGKMSGNIVNKPELVGATAKVSLIELQDFLALATWEAVVNQNIEVGKILATGLGDSIRSLAYKQLGIELEEEDRQEWIERRNKTRIDFHPVLTDSIKRNLNPESSQEWGKYIWQFQDALGIDSGTRDKLPSGKLLELAIAQNTAAALLDAGVSWREVLHKIAA